MDESCNVIVSAENQIPHIALLTKLPIIPITLVIQ